jgi:carbamoyl-phosphate synthase large subunit
MSSAGRRVALANCFRASAQALGMDLKIFAADAVPELSPACALADRAFRVPPCRDPSFIGELVRICDRERIDLVVPTIDTELLALAENRRRFLENGTQVSVSDASAVALARDKLATSEHLRARGVHAPQTWSVSSVLELPDAFSWPMFAKPVGGSSSVGAALATNISSLERMTERHPDLLLQEVVHGDEFTINMYFDFAGVLRATVPHRRIEVRGGEVSKGVTSDDPRLLGIARQFSTAFPPLRGVVCIQVFMQSEADSSPWVTDVNLRFGGGYPLAHAAGGEFTRWLLEERVGRVPSWGNGGFANGLMMLRYDAAVFVRGTSATFQK